MSEATTADIRFHRPAEAFANLVTAIYFVEVKGPDDAEIPDLLHPEWGNLRFGTGAPWDIAMGDTFASIPAPTLFGPTSRARAIRARPGTVIGIGFTPQGWNSLIGVSASQLADRVVAADPVLPGIAEIDRRLRAAAGDVARLEAVNTYLASLRRAGRVPDRRIDTVLSRLGESDDQSVEELADAVGMNPTQLSRNCRRWFGFTTKILMRRQRFLRTLARLMSPEGHSISDVLDDAYCDQSHFNREFRRFMGMPPRAYFARPRSILRAAARSREQEIGEALQGLHRGRRMATAAKPPPTP